MIISNLNHLDIVSEQNQSQVEGAFARADSHANAYAYGPYFAYTNSFSNTSAVSGYYYNEASSTSGSTSIAY